MRRGCADRAATCATRRRQDTYTQGSQPTRSHGAPIDAEHGKLYTKLLVLLLFCATSLCGCKSVFFGTVGVLGGHGAQVHADITFDAPHALKLDVYSPKNAAASPVVVFFYGGAWVNGERAWYRYAGEA